MARVFVTTGEKSFSQLYSKPPDWVEGRSTKLGSGTYGVVFPCCPIGDKDCPLAVKGIGWSNIEQRIADEECKDLESEENPEEKIMTIVPDYVASEFLTSEALIKHPHPNLVKVHYVTVIHEPQRSCLIVMDRAKCSLDEYVAKLEGPVTEKLLRGWLRALLHGLVHMHDVLRLVHRDLKPNNILVKPGRRPNVCIADFNSVIRQGERSGSLDGDSLTTLNYRSPEALLEGDDNSYATDIWALGCIACTCATSQWFTFKPNDTGSEFGSLMSIFSVLGKPTEKDHPSLFHLPTFKSSFPNFQRKSEVVTFVPRLSHGFNVFVNHLLELEPTKRPTAKEALRHKYMTRGIQ